jgi:hypothetical protein
LKRSRDRRRLRIRLTTPNGNGIFAFRNNRRTRFRDHAQVAISQLELHCLRLADLQMNALEPAQRTQWRTRDVREFEIQLRHFISVSFAGVGNRHFRGERVTRLDYAKGAPKSRMEWTPAQLATITPVEGAAISVEAYLYKVKVESSSVNAKSGGESTNCHARLASDVDWHMPVTANGGEGENVAIIVETTPRVRRQHSNWTTAQLKPWTSHVGNKANASYNQQKVRISGWLMLDPEHQDMIDEGLRSTLWEIHPITKIEVWSHGAWVDVDNP